MSHEEFIIFLDAAVKKLHTDVGYLILAEEKDSELMQKAIKMLGMVKDDLDNIYVRLDKLEEDNG